MTEEDIRAGRYDQAELKHWLVDWERPELKILMFAGWLGEIRRSDGRFEVELRGPSETLNTPIGRTILRSCDRILGDGKCGVDLSQTSFSAVVSVSRMLAGNRFVCDGLARFGPGWFSHGKVTWLSGYNEGGTSAVKADRILPDGNRILDLWQQPCSEIRNGDQFRAVAGCDKLSSTCLSKFANLLNFRGFPHIPGEDWVLAYPRSGGIHDGTSQQRD